LSAPLLIAWAAPELCRLSPTGEIVYAHAFEAIVGASGFAAANPSQRLTGIVGAPCEEIPDTGPGDGLQVRVAFGEVMICATGDTCLDRLGEFQEQIMADYRKQGGARQ
jgi:hypothetical protein